MTDPEHQRRGAGTMLLQWGCEAADNNGVPVYLQASLAGYQTYKKCGFEEVYTIDLDLGDFGLQGLHRTWLMARHSQARPEKIS